MNVKALIGVATLLSAGGIYLMLPRGTLLGRMVGAAFAAAGLVLIALELPRFGDPASESVFFVLAAVTVMSAVATISSRSPVYAAIWFGLSLLGTAGLMLFQGAQFLGVATIVVYAGAILVTFLFVLMLAQPDGNSPYDRLSWEGLLSAATGALMIGTVTVAVLTVFRDSAPTIVRHPATAEARSTEILAGEHMAHLGRELFSRHLIAVEVAGTLLLVALVGSIAIVAYARPAGTPRRTARDVP